MSDPAPEGTKYVRHGLCLRRSHDFILVESSTWSMQSLHRGRGVFGSGDGHPESARSTAGGGCRGRGGFRGKRRFGHETGNGDGCGYRWAVGRTASGRWRSFGWRRQGSLRNSVHGRWAVQLRWLLHRRRRWWRRRRGWRQRRLRVLHLPMRCQRGLSRPPDLRSLQQPRLLQGVFLDSSVALADVSARRSRETRSSGETRS
jgi:hypothetical protein